MLVKFFKRGKGGGSGPINYLLGDDYLKNNNVSREGAKLLYGSPHLINEMINASNFAQRYTAGCLSFEESPDSLTEQQKIELMRDFEKTLFPGLEPDQYSILWVEHGDKDNPNNSNKKRLELNFLIPNTELRTCKRLQPYYYKQDQKYIRNWQTMKNNEYTLSSPDDPRHSRLINIYNEKNNQVDPLKKKISEHLKGYHKVLNSRKDVIYHLLKLDEIEAVSRESKEFISVKVKDRTKPVRLKGDYFKRDFTRQDIYNKDIPQPRQQKIDNWVNAEKEYKEMFEIKKTEQAIKYSTPEAAQTSADTPTADQPKPTPQAEQARKHKPQ